MLIADAALLAFCASATIQRYVSGASGADWIVLGVVWVIALWLTAGELAICSLDISRAPIISMMPAMIIAAVVLFCAYHSMPVPRTVMRAPLLLVLGAAMRHGHPDQARDRPFADVPDRGGRGTAVGATDLGWIIGGMIDWAGPQISTAKQPQLMHAERRERAKQYALDRAGIVAEVHDVVAHLAEHRAAECDSAACRAIESGQHPEIDGDIAETLDDAARCGASGAVGDE